MPTSARPFPSTRCFPPGVERARKDRGRDRRGHSLWHCSSSFTERDAPMARLCVPTGALEAGIGSQPDVVLLGIGIVHSRGDRAVVDGPPPVAGRPGSCPPGPPRPTVAVACLGCRARGAWQADHHRCGSRQGRSPARTHREPATTTGVTEPAATPTGGWLLIGSGGKPHHPSETYKGVAKWTNRLCWNRRPSMTSSTISRCWRIGTIATAMSLNSAAALMPMSELDRTPTPTRCRAAPARSGSSPVDTQPLW